MAAKKTQPITGEKVPKRTALNLGDEVWSMVRSEALIEDPDEKPNMSKMGRTLIREAVRARQLARTSKKPKQDGHAPV